jgi:hypothetical protein
VKILNSFCPSLVSTLVLMKVLQDKLWCLCCIPGRLQDWISILSLPDCRTEVYNTAKVTRDYQIWHISFAFFIFVQQRKYAEISYAENNLSPCVWRCIRENEFWMKLIRFKWSYLLCIDLFTLKMYLKYKFFNIMQKQLFTLKMYLKLCDKNKNLFHSLYLMFSV